MPEQLYFIEILLRGGAAGACLIFAARLVNRSKLSSTGNFGALFAIGTAAYIIASSPYVTVISPIWLSIIYAVATLNSVFFWWFATSLFEEDFQWSWLRWLPFIVMFGLALVRRLKPELVAGELDDILQQVLILAIMAHAIWMAIAYYKTDLIQSRRQFRLMFIGSVAATGTIIAIVEISVGDSVPSASLTLFHAGMLFVMAQTFAVWLFPIPDLFATQARSPAKEQFEDPVDRLALRRLEEIMQQGAYLEERLTLTMLSERLDYPEYRLRHLINRALGYPNFNAFVNHYRIEEAKKILSDPTQTGRQVTLVAFDLGFGSTATFNRAFRKIAGTSPSTFRKAEIERMEQDRAER